MLEGVGRAAGDGQASSVAAALPPLFQMLAATIPLEALLALSGRCGGMRLYVPKVPNSTSRLAQVLDPKAFDALTRICGGEVIDVPIAAAAHRHVRNRAIVEALANGESKSAVATQFCLSRRTVYYISSAHATRAKPTRKRKLP
jgi:hypothetical protein